MKIKLETYAIKETSTEKVWKEVKAGYMNQKYAELSLPILAGRADVRKARVEGRHVVYESLSVVRYIEVDSLETLAKLIGDNRVSIEVTDGVIILNDID